MPFYIIEFRESDGNDCTVYDAVVEATDEREATEKVADAVEAELKANGTGFEGDGGWGLYFDCTCPEPPEGEESMCEGHGGITFNEPGYPELEAYATETEAEADCAFYHCRWHIPSEQAAQDAARERGE